VINLTISTSKLDENLENIKFPKTIIINTDTNILAGLNFIFFKYKNIVDKPKNTNKIRVLPDKTAAIINEKT
jgi:tRNA uridine 5-carbamoylmethylation protein Kti12